MTVTRGTSNGNERGNADTRRRRRAFIVEHYPADVDMLAVLFDDGRVIVTASPFSPDPGCEMWLETNIAWAANQFLRVEPPGVVHIIDAIVVPAVRCSRCGRLCHDEVVYESEIVLEASFTCDRIFPGAKGGKYGGPARDRREKRTNVRPYCGLCNSITGGALASRPKRRRRLLPRRRTMIVTCNTDYWEFMQSMKPPEAPCGRTYDDVDHSTRCPHEELGTAGLVCKESDLYKSVCPHCNPPLSRCSSCGRSTYDPELVGKVCGMTQPSGEKCAGTFPPTP